MAAALNVTRRLRVLQAVFQVPPESTSLAPSSPRLTALLPSATNRRRPTPSAHSGPRIGDSPFSQTGCCRKKSKPEQLAHDLFLPVTPLAMTRMRQRTPREDRETGSSPPSFSLPVRSLSARPDELPRTGMDYFVLNTMYMVRVFHFSVLYDLLGICARGCLPTASNVLPADRYFSLKTPRIPRTLAPFLRSTRSRCGRCRPHIDILRLWVHHPEHAAAYAHG